MVVQEREGGTPPSAPSVQGPWPSPAAGGPGAPFIWHFCSAYVNFFSRPPFRPSVSEFSEVAASQPLPRSVVAPFWTPSSRLNINIAAPSSEEMPRWRATLMAVPEEARSASQRDLIRGLQLADFLKEELQKPFLTSLDDPRALKMLLVSCEAEMLGPSHFSAVRLLDQASYERLKDFAIAMKDLIATMFCSSEMSTPEQAQLKPKGESVVAAVLGCAISLSLLLRRSAAP